MRLGLQHTFAQDLPEFVREWRPVGAVAPRLLFWNGELSRELGLPLDGVDEDGLAETFSGNRLPEDAHPVAQAYAGHQFGGFSPRLGDGRALLLGEVAGPDGSCRDLAFKGSGPTPFSRGGDGLAATGPMLREVLVGEWLHAVGIPTTRALAVVATGGVVRRETELPGAVLTRVAASHIRVGSFELFAATGELGPVLRLAEHAIARHFPDLAREPDRLALFLRETALRQAELVAAWTLAGFVHGVMNTDNMAVSGESLDFGPCAFLERFDPAAVFSSIDHGGRYAFGNQPSMARWNLERLGDCLAPLLDPDPDRAAAWVGEAMDGFVARFRQALREGRIRKLGLAPGVAEEDEQLGADWTRLLQQGGADHALAWRRLAEAAEGDELPLRALFSEPEALDGWLTRWRERCEREDSGADPIAAGRNRAAGLRRTNPLRIPRNHLVEEALEAATAGEIAPFRALLSALRDPWSKEGAPPRFAEPAPRGFLERYRTFCGT